MTIQTPSADWYFSEIVVKMIKDGKSRDLIKNTLLEKFRDELQNTVEFRSGANDFWGVPDSPENRRILTNALINVEKKWHKLWNKMMHFYESRGIIGPEDLAEFLDKTLPEPREKHT